jgi:uncharacterized membrane protein YhaH (DUF805 family)
MTSETFEQVLTAAQADGAFAPAWKKFVNTRFFVPVVPAAGDARKFTLHLAPGAEHGSQAIRISEVRERLAQPQGTTLATLTGADVVRMLHAEADILIALSDRAFSIARERVDWLKKGIEASQARAAAKALEAAAPAPVAAPQPPAAPVVAPAPAPAKAPRRSQVLDVSALRPRSVSLAKVGLDFFVPGDWREVQDTKGLRLVDAASGINLLASGMHRPGMTLAQWQAMRMTLVQHEMRYLTQDGASYDIDGDNWRSRIKGMATEFVGTFPGDDFPSRYLVAVIHTEGTVASIAIRAPAEAFEDNRALFKWLLARIDVRPEAAVEMTVVSGREARRTSFDDDAVPGVVGLSVRGRISRLQAMAYSFAVMLPMVVVAVIVALIPQRNPTALIAMLITALVITCWFAVRLIVLRLHDCNRSGKWIIGLPALALLFGVLRLPSLAGWTLLAFWVLVLLFYFLVPGTDGDNDFGAPPDENSGWVKFGAALFVALQLAGVMGAPKVMNAPGAFRSPLGASSSAVQSEAGQPFSPPDRSFMVTVPGIPAPMPSMPGLARLQHYQLQTDRQLYIMQSIDYGKTPLDRYGIMDKLEADVVGRDGTLISSKPVYLRGLKGREVRVQLPNGMQRAARFVLSDTHMFNVVVIAHESDQAAINAFLTSLVLL